MQILKLFLTPKCDSNAEKSLLTAKAGKRRGWNLTCAGQGLWIMLAV